MGSMAFNYYSGWTEARLLAERDMVQRQLASGRITEIRLAGEGTRTDDAKSTPLEVTLERLAYALYRLYSAGGTDTAYENPYGDVGVTLQRRF